MFSISRKYEIWKISFSGKSYFLFNITDLLQSEFDYGMNISISEFYCNESYLKVVNNKSIMFEQLITAAI